MHRYAHPSFYFRKLYKAWYLHFRHDPANIAAEEDRKLAGFGDVSAATERLNGIFAARGRGAYDPDTDSVHMLLWSILSLRYPAKRILEIGTFEGEGTNVLARLYPAAEVTTVELPDDDPLFRSFYRRSSEYERQAFREKQEKNLALPNIRPLKSNSFFLPQHLDGAFDLIWVDGGHLYPEVAWDICNAWNLAAPGGIILFDDIVPDTKGGRTPLISSESYEVLEYLRARIPSLDFTLFLKRRFPFRGEDILKKTCVAVVTKPFEA